MRSEQEKIRILSTQIKGVSKKNINIMEVCGTHTMSIARHGIRSLLPENINIISGPGCPVCVTSAGDIHLAIELSKRDDFLVATFGDMLKVPSQGETLQGRKSVAMIYSPLDAVKLAKDNPKKEVVFLGIGFETTAPLIAATIKSAKSEGVNNFSVLSMHKTVPVALDVILSAPGNKIQGLLLPGHVGAITGRRYFDFLKRYQVSGIVTGFAAINMMESLYLLASHLNEERYDIVNNYTHIVSEEGNVCAQEVLAEVFEESDAEWRGIGMIPGSGLKMRSEFEAFDAYKKFSLKTPKIAEAAGCLCGPILMGKNKPSECKHFGKTCTPATPVGPCMVSSEGTCAAYYKYGVNV
ncbi:MAG: hydrogenase formation protein HypD [Oligoflexia bacterium]|nr:hydrogenase formation protein HypD [Oligoflexia bacterium]MBF0365346.1 hydrogenase formation protein HypD [Oligoflexia bacterium]